MNLFENGSSDTPDQPVEYEELSNVINFDDFDFNQWRSGEIDVLQPQLVAQGYTDIQWYMGEQDSFGPLTRICICRNAAGEIKQYIYG